VRCASAGKGISPSCCGCGETGKVCATCGCSCSSKITIPSSPSGNQSGRLRQGKEFWTILESRQAITLVPPVKSPPLMKRVAKLVASGSRLSAAVQFT